MVQIVDLKKTKTGFSVTFSSGETLKISENTKLEFLLYTGKELDSATLFALKDYEAVAKAYSYLLLLVNRGSYSCKMINDKLIKKGYSPEVALRLVKRAEEAGVLNDENYARARLNYLITRKNVSKKLVVRDLKIKGINEFMISDILYEFPAFEKDALAARYLKLLRKYQKLDNKTRNEKIKAKLYSEGFPFSLIKEVIVEAQLSADLNEEN